MKRFLLYTLYTFIFLLATVAQTQIRWGNPLDLPVSLSGNFGELRANHFHGGVDFRTNAEENKWVYAAADGFISRVLISPVGYGKALYITHADGFITLCAHLNRFSPWIEDIVTEAQRKAESYAIDLTFAPGVFPVETGEIIALSGNTGSSGGPHLHFELRDSLDNQLDYLSFISHRLRDTTPPTVYGLMLYRLGVQGANGEPVEQLPIPVEGAPGSYRVASPLRSYGTVAFGLRALDFMEGVANNYGVKRVELWCGDRLWFASTMDTIPIAESRQINAFTDYHTWQTERLFYQKSYVEPGNLMPGVVSQSAGTIRLLPWSRHQMRYKIFDSAGNLSQVDFELRGSWSFDFLKSTERKKPNLLCWTDNYFRFDAGFIHFPYRALYTDQSFAYYQRTDSTGRVYHGIGRSTVPLHRPVTIGLRLDSTLLAFPPRQRVAIYRDRRTTDYYIGKEEDGRHVFQSYRLGEYELSVDTIAPSIRPRVPSRWGELNLISFETRDSGVGIEHYKGYIDDQFALFEYDRKSNNLYCYLGRENLERNKWHELRLEVTDLCDNRSTYASRFFY